MLANDSPLLIKFHKEKTGELGADVDGGLLGMRNYTQSKKNWIYEEEKKTKFLLDERDAQEWTLHKDVDRKLFHGQRHAIYSLTIKTCRRGDTPNRTSGITI